LFSSVDSNSTNCAASCRERLSFMRPWKPLKTKTTNRNLSEEDGRDVQDLYYCLLKPRNVADQPEQHKPSIVDSLHQAGNLLGGLRDLGPVPSFE
jgi:hypothetical protein